MKARECRTLGQWLQGIFMESRSALKPESTPEAGADPQQAGGVLRQGRAAAPAHLGRGSLRWRAAIGKRGLSEAAVKKHVGNAKTMFREVVEREVMARSPFAHLKGGVTPTKNARYVTPEELEAVLAAAPDAEWRVLLGLARLAGLRTPSETHLVTFRDIDWESGLMRVRSPKTERHPGHAERVVPIVPRLMELDRGAVRRPRRGRRRPPRHDPLGGRAAQEGRRHHRGRGGRAVGRCLADAASLARDRVDATTASRLRPSAGGSGTRYQ